MNAGSFRRFFARAALLLGAAAAALLVAEGVLRVAHRRDTVLFPRYHADARYGPCRLRRLRPLTTFRHTSIDGSWTFTVNRQGFRDDRDYACDKPPDI